jgi:hypothetical protein
LYRTSDENLTDSSSDNNYDLYIFDGMVPETLPAEGNILFINCEHSDIFESCGKVQGKKLTFVDSDVTYYVADSQFGVNETNIYQVPGWGTGFLKTGDDFAGFYGSYDGRKIAVMGFDLHQTDLGLQAQFPMLVSELADYLLDSGLTEQNSYTAGENVMLHGNTRGEALILTQPDGKTQTIDSSQAAGSYVQVTATGIYGVSQEVDSQIKQQKFAVGFPSELESAVVSAQSMTGDEGNTAVQMRVGALEIRNYVLLFLLLLLAGEWILYIRMQ